VIVEAYAGDAAVWNGRVETDPAGTFCHLYGWAGAIADGLGHDVELLAATSAGELVGQMPIARVAGPLGSYLVSTPFLNYGGPIGTPEAVRALIEHAVAAGRRTGVDLVEMRCRHRTWNAGGNGAVPAALPEHVRVSDRRLTVVLPLPEDPDELWDALRSKVRSQVRRPLKEGMEARFGTEQLDAFYGVFARNMRDLGTPVLPLGFFRAMLAHFPGLVRVGAVYHAGEPVAGGFGFLWRGEFEMTWASSLREFGRLAPNMLLYWAFMRHAVEVGARSFNFGRCPPDSGTHRFKRQWGGEDEPLPWLQWSTAGAAGTPSARSGRFALATAVWRRLPVPLATRLGPWIARTIP
jgi:serine/alanine adding enzyme